jgi:hypothetical protein
MLCGCSMTIQPLCSVSLLTIPERLYVFRRKYQLLTIASFVVFEISLDISCFILKYIVGRQNSIFHVMDKWFFYICNKGYTKIFETKVPDPPLVYNSLLSINHIKRSMSINNTLVCYVSFHMYMHVCMIIQHTYLLAYLSCFDSFNFQKRRALHYIMKNYK